MKTLLLLYFLTVSTFLHSMNHLGIHSGVSYPGGFLAGIEIDTDQFSSSLEFNYSGETADITKMFFTSDYLSLGSVSFNGFLKGQKSEKFHFFSIDEKSRALINRDGNPQNNLGVIFLPAPQDSGIAGFRTEDYSQVLLWANIYKAGFLNISLRQSLTVNENKEQPDSWYREKRVIQSDVLSSSSLSFIAGDKAFFTGGSLSFSGAAEDPPGYSISSIFGFSFSAYTIQNELTFNSPVYTSADLVISPYQFVLKGRVLYNKKDIESESKVIFYSKGHPFPGKNRLWSILFETDFLYEKDTFDFDSELKLEFYNDDYSFLLFAPSISVSLKKTFGDFFLETEGRASHRDLYCYGLAVKAGVENRTLKARFSTELEIDDKVTVNGKLSLVVYRKNFDFSIWFSLENAGLYNSEQLELKPSFFIGAELK